MKLIQQINTPGNSCEFYVPKYTQVSIDSQYLCWITYLPFKTTTCNNIISLI